LTLRKDQEKEPLIGDCGDLHLKEINPPPNNQNPSTNEIHLVDFAQENLCRAHNANHSERTCPAFVNMFKVFTEMEEEEENKTNDNE
jgi:hypothetical protein